MGYVPFVYYPVFYAFRGLCNGDSFENSLRAYGQNIVTDNAANWGFWFPGDIICFSIPAWARLPFSHAAGYVWNSILSWMRGNVDASETCTVHPEHVQFPKPNILCAAAAA